MTVSQLPVVNASLNALAFLLLFLGWRKIRAGQVRAHKRLMVGAFVTSCAFLACYVTYHYAHGHTTFTRTGWRRLVYMTVLATHVPLAALMVPPILTVIWFGLTDRLEKHRRLARWTLPVWMYVSVTGVLLYVMLYHIWPHH